MFRGYDLDNESNDNLIDIYLNTVPDSNTNANEIKELRIDIIDQLLQRLYEEKLSIDILKDERMVKTMHRRLLEGESYARYIPRLGPVIGAYINTFVSSPVSSTGRVSPSLSAKSRSRKHGISPSLSAKGRRKLETRSNNSGESGTTGENSADLDSANNSIISEVESLASASADIGFDITNILQQNLANTDLHQVAYSMRRYRDSIKPKIDSLGKLGSIVISILDGVTTDIHIIYEEYANMYNYISDMIKDVSRKLQTIEVGDAGKRIRFFKESMIIDTEITRYFEKYKSGFEKKFIGTIKRLYQGLSEFDVHLCHDTINFMRKINMELNGNSRTSRYTYDIFIGSLKTHVDMHLARNKNIVLNELIVEIMNTHERLVDKLSNGEKLRDEEIAAHPRISQYFKLEKEASELTPSWDVKASFDAEMRKDGSLLRRLLVFCRGYMKLHKKYRNREEYRQMLYFVFPEDMHFFEERNITRFRTPAEIIDFLMPTIYCIVDSSTKTSLMVRVVDTNSRISRSGTSNDGLWKSVAYKKYLELSRFRDDKDKSGKKINIVGKSTTRYLLEQLEALYGEPLPQTISDASSGDESNRDSTEDYGPPSVPSPETAMAPSPPRAAASSRPNSSRQSSTNL